MTATAPRKALSAFWGEPAFSIGGTDVLWVDVAIGAMAHGDWTAFERRLTEGLACAAKARAEGVDTDAEALEEAATAFRYERDLISGADMNAWLDGAGLTTADWTAYLTRYILWRRLGPVTDVVLDQYAPSARQLLESALAEGVCSGEFDTLQRSLAGRLALAAAEEGSGSKAEDAAAPALEQEAIRLAHRHVHWMGGWPAEDVRSRFLALLRVDQIYRTAIKALTTQDALQRVIETRGVEWALLTLDTLKLPTEHAAREALLCLRVDGLSMPDVGRLARQTSERRIVFVEDVPPEQRPHLLSADAGQVFGPFLVDGGFEVMRVAARTDPALQDARVAERARRVAVHEAAGRAIRERVSRRSSS